MGQAHDSMLDATCCRVVHQIKLFLMLSWQAACLAAAFTCGAFVQMPIVELLCRVVIQEAAEATKLNARAAGRAGGSRREPDQPVDKQEVLDWLETPDASSLEPVADLPSLMLRMCW